MANLSEIKTEVIHRFCWKLWGITCIMLTIMWKSYLICGKLQKISKFADKSFEKIVDICYNRDSLIRGDYYECKDFRPSVVAA